MNIQFQSGGDAVPGGYNGYFVANGPDGEKLGYLDYQIITDRRWDDGKVLVAMVEVAPEYRRQGVAAALLARLREEFPDRDVEPGYLTDDGAAWWASVSKESYAVHHAVQGPHRGRGADPGARGALGRDAGAVGRDERGLPGRLSERRYTIYVIRSAQEDYRSLQQPIKTRVRRMVKALARDAFPGNSHSLSGPYRSYRALEIGDHYRVLYGVQGGHVTVYAVGSHENYYKKFRGRID